MDNKSQAWPPPYSQDCSQGYCSYYCPQYCFFLFPPPPPPSPSAHLLLSPLLIAVIAVVSAAFLLIAYYMLHTAYCNRQNNMISSAVLGLGPATSPENPTAWPPSHPASGVDVSLINKIAVYSYQSGTNLPVGGTDCSVCLSSYEDGDQIRFLPKCSHAFHVPCIDTWLKSHSNCPLCRAAIFPSLIPTVGGGGGQIDHTSVTVVVQDPTTHTSSDNNNNETDVGHVDIIEIDRRREG